jgi:phage regulator Rha-like protein
VQIEKIQTKIYEIRGQKVMLDFDLAELYEVETRILNQAVKRNIDIFPEDFMFQLTQTEWESNSSQFVMSSRKHRGTIYLPFAFTERGVTMLANVLKSRKARQTSIAIVRAFITLKQFVLTYKELSEKLQELEDKYDKQFKSVYDAINFLLQKDIQQTEQKQRKRIGYKNDESN